MEALHGAAWEKIASASIYVETGSTLGWHPDARFAQAIADAEERGRGKWIAIEEELPKRGLSVLVMRSGIGQDIGRLIARGRKDVWEQHSGHPLTNVTHWRRLPDPPKSLAISVEALPW